MILHSLLFSYNGSMSKTPSIGWSTFALNHSAEGTGNSYTKHDFNFVSTLVGNNWDNQAPGAGETDCSRKILVTVPPEGFFLPPRIALTARVSALCDDPLPIRAEVVRRRDHEDPYIETFVTPEDAAEFGFTETPATKVKIVLYSAEALSENGETRSTACDWEIVCLLCEDNSDDEPMAFLTMARNFLEKEGGTLSVYTAQEFAEAIYYHSNRGVRVRPAR